MLALCGPLCVSANQADRKQSELDALKQRLQTLQQDFHATQTHQQEAADELRQSERAISSSVRQLRQLDGERQRTQGDLQSLTQQADATSARIRTQQAHLAQTLKGAYLRGQGDALKLILNGADPNQTARDLRYLAQLSRAQHGHDRIVAGRPGATVRPAASGHTKNDANWRNCRRHTRPSRKSWWPTSRPASRCCRNSP